MADSSDDDGLYGKAFAVVAANATTLLVFITGPEGLQALSGGGNPLGSGFFSSVGITGFTTILYLSLSVSSLIAAALALSALVLPLGTPGPYLRAGAGLLGLALLAFVLHLLAASFQFGGPLDEYFWIGIGVYFFLISFALVAAVLRARRAE